MEKVSIPETGELYVWVKNKDIGDGKVVLRISSLLEAVIPMVISGGVEEHINSLPYSSDMFLPPESVEEWGYDLKAYSAYSLGDSDSDVDKYVWYTRGSYPKVLVLFKYNNKICVGTLGYQHPENLVGITKYMLSEEEVENSVFDANKFLSVGENGLLVRGEAQEVAESPTPNLTRKPQYKMSDKFDKLHSEDIVVITIANKEEANILAGLLPIDYEYHVGDSDEDTSEALVVYPEQTGYSADFNMLEHNIGNPIMSFAEAVVELSPDTISTDGDASDVISAHYVTANGTALDLSHTPISAGNSHDVGKLTSSKITLGYKTTDKFKEALRKGAVLIPVEDAIEAAILGTVFEIDPGYKYNEGYSTLGVSALIVSKWLPAMFGPYLNLPGVEEIAFGDAVEGAYIIPYKPF